jgi:hypothetical protein
MSLAHFRKCVVLDELQGAQMQSVITVVRPSQLLLDPNNYRFHDLRSYRRVANRARFTESGVQDKAYRLLRETESFELESLKESIASNGFVPVEQIVVERFSGDGENAHYLVVEGNRRTAAIKSLLEEVGEGSRQLSDKVLESIQKISVVEIVGTTTERKAYQQTLMAIRHVAGVKEWGPYQQARLIVELYEKEKNFSAVAKRIGISNKEVARRYRASRALEQMETDEEFNQHAGPDLYVFFHEAISQPKVREWLKFSDDTFKAEDEAARRTFYELLSPREVDGKILPKKLQSANSQVRMLKEIVDKPQALEILQDPEREFEDAVAAARDSALRRDDGALERALAVAIRALREPGVDEWSSASARSVEMFEELLRLVRASEKLMPSNES